VLVLRGCRASFFNHPGFLGWEPQGHCPAFLAGTRKKAAFYLEAVYTRPVTETFERILTDFLRKERNFADAKRGGQTKKARNQPKRRERTLVWTPSNDSSEKSRCRIVKKNTPFLQGTGKAKNLYS
jgi:hypothetical protein